MNIWKINPLKIKKQEQNSSVLAEANQEIKTSKEDAKLPNNPNYWQKLNSVFCKKDNALKEEENFFENKIYRLALNKGDINVGEFPCKCYGQNLGSLLANSTFDKKTGELNPLALDFLDKYFFETTHGVNFGEFYSDKNNLANDLKFYLDRAKDKNGNFDSKRFEIIGKFVEREYINKHGKDSLEKFLALVEDKNGQICDELLNITNTVMNYEEEYPNVYFYTAGYSRLEENAQHVFNRCKQFYNNDEACALKNLRYYNELFYSKNSKLNKGSKKIANEIFSKHPNLKYDIEELCTYVGYKIFQEPINAKFLEAMDMNMDLDDFYKCLYLYTNNENLLKDNKLETFDIAFEVYKKCKEQNLEKEVFGNILKTAISPYISYDYCSNPSLGQRERLLNGLKYLESELGFIKIKTNKFDFDTQTLFNELQNYKNDKIFNEVGEIEKKNFLFSVLKTSGSDEFSSFEKTLVDAIPQLKRMKEGVKISYSRKEFLNDLTKLQVQKDIFKKLEISPIVENEKIIGYDGLINLNNLDKNNPYESKVYNLCHKFLYENEVKTNDENLNKELNNIIKIFPEFINIIGKKQHATHDYSTDVHSLLVLANSINNPEYQDLKEPDKAALKMVCLFHDIAKKENVVDKGHQNESAFIIRGICDKVFKSSEVKDRIFELTKNHHWLEEWNSPLAKFSNKDTELAFAFRGVNDFKIAKIIAKADLMGVSDEFYNSHKQPLDDVSAIEEKINIMYSTGQAIFSDVPFVKSKLKNHTENLNGIDYQVINFHNIKPDEDLYEYGFNHKTKNDAMFLVHMIPESAQEIALESLNELSNSKNEGVLSQALITPEQNKTFMDRDFGVILSCKNTNIINISKENQGSGFKKSVSENIPSLIFTYGTRNEEYRTNFRNSLLKNLSIKEKSVSDDEFAMFYKDNIASKDSLEQIADSKTYTLGNKTFSAKELKKALLKFQKSLISDNKNNEIVGYTPKIRAVVAKKKSLEELPKELLEFAHSKNLPIVLI